MLKTLTAAVLAALVLMPAGLPLAADDVKPHPGGWIQAEWLKGRPVVNATGKEMGKIEEVWMDPKNGRVKELVVEVNEQRLRAAETRDRSRQPSASPR